MLKKILKVTAVLLLVGFSFFYTEKVTIIARNSDPIMRAIKEEEKDITLAFRGSRNQRVIDMQKSLKEKEIILYLE